MLPVLAVILTLNATAQDSAKTFVLSGSADGYYRYNFMAPAGATNNKTSFTNSQNSFELGMATVRADASADGGKITATADLGFGRRAEEFSYADGTGGLGTASVNSANLFTTLAAVKQLYFNYTPGKYWTYTIGKWATHIGYEVLDAYANRNYSMDYMFSFGPFSHTGFKAQYTKGNVGFMIGIANPTDNTTSLGSGVKTLIAQFSDSLGKVKAYLNYQGFFGANQGTFAPNTHTKQLLIITLKSLNQVDLVLTLLHLIANGGLVSMEQHSSVLILQLLLVLKHGGALLCILISIQIPKWAGLSEANMLEIANLALCQTRVFMI